MRRLTPLAVLLLAACSSSSEAPPPVAPGEERIACAVGGATEFSTICAVERTRADGHDVLVVHHPDGAFRRFDVQEDGTGVAVTDGAEAAQVRLDGGLLDVTVGADRYRFPARVEPDAGA